MARAITHISADESRSKTDQILARLKSGQSLNRLEAFLVYGINDLTATIRDMRIKHGIDRDRIVRTRVPIQEAVRLLNRSGFSISPSSYDVTLTTTSYSMR
jgi:hypothetical protein